MTRHCLNGETDSRPRAPGSPSPKAGLRNWLTVTAAVGLLFGLTSWAAAQVSGLRGPIVPAQAIEPKPLPGGQLPRGEPLPPPRTVPGFAPGQIRMPALGQDGVTVGSTPKPSLPVMQEYSSYVKQVVTPENTLDLVVGRTHLLMLSGTPKRIQVADETIAGYTVITPTELSVLGKEVGSTVLTLWFTDQKDMTKQRVLSYLVRVLPDPEAKERLERVFKALEAEVNRTFPDSRVMLTLTGDKLIVTGQARDVVEATNIIRVIEANLPRGNTRESIPERDTRIPTDRFSAGPAGQAGLNVPGISDYVVAGGPQLINLLRVPGEQQVSLQVTVAEVNRAAARSIGLNFNVFNNNGTVVSGGLVGGISNNGIGFGGGGGNFTNFGGAGNGFGNQRFSPFNVLPVALDNGQIQLAINALRELKYARTLAEPNLVTMNGQTANFQAGSLFPIPYVAGFTNVGLQGINYFPVGVQLSFTPVIMDKDKVRLTISAEVSDRDPAVGPTFINGTSIPNLITRNFNTVVELREGQTLAVAGLIQNRLGAQAERIPLFGDLPLVGPLFGFNRTAAHEDELVILITPELVHPMEPKQVPSLPGSDLFEPNDCEFYIHNRLESLYDCDYRSPVRTDFHRILKQRCTDDRYIAGPHGYGGPGGLGDVPAPIATPISEPMPVPEVGVPVGRPLPPLGGQPATLPDATGRGSINGATNIPLAPIGPGGTAVPGPAPQGGGNAFGTVPR